jgi:hypothetical protein
MYIAKFNNQTFLLSIPADDAIVALVVTPTELEDSDSRCLKVIKSIDTATDDIDYSVMFPEINDDEHEMWANAMQCAAAFMMGAEQDNVGE